MKRLAIVMMLTSGLLAGCGGTSPPSRFYTLDAVPAISAAPAQAAHTVAVGPVTVPDIVDRPQLVVRTGPHRVELAELARWAEPLKLAIPRVIAAQIERRLPAVQAAASTPRAIAAADYRVALDIERFESALGEGATIEAAWTITGPAFSRTGRTLAREPAGGQHEDLVAAHSRALQRVGDDIAAALGPALKPKSGSE